MFVSEIGHDPLYAPWTKGNIVTVVGYLWS